MKSVNAGLAEYNEALKKLNEKLISIDKSIEIRAIGGYAMLYNELRTGGYTIDVDTATLKYNKKVAAHRKVAWESDNVSVATVKNGKITAVGKGTCYVYAYAQNGVSAKIKVTVK